MMLDLTNYVQIAEHLRSSLANGFYSEDLQEECQLKSDKEGNDSIEVWENDGHAAIHIRSTHGIHMLEQGDSVDISSDRVVITKDDPFIHNRNWVWYLLRAQPTIATRSGNFQDSNSA